MTSPERFNRWDLTRRGDAGRQMERAGDVRAVAFSPDGRLLASVSEAGRADRVGAELTLWDPRRAGGSLGHLQFHDDPVCIAFAPGGDRIATGGWDGIVRVWDTKAILARAGE